MSSLLTIAGIEVGKAVAKSIFKLWVKDDALSDMSANLVDLVGSKTSDPMVQRRGDREFQDIADKISEEIVPVLERDGAHLDEGERAAVAHAVAETLNKARLSRDLLLERNLQPTQLEQHVRAANPYATRDLSEAATQLYNRIIKECCTYIVDIASQLPAFNEHTFAELLKRGDQIGKKVDVALVELRKISEDLDLTKAADRFEKDYREAVTRKLDELNLIGADVSSRNRRHKLSVAYISLSVAQTLPVSLSEIDEDENSDEEEDGKDSLPVEAVLASSQRLLIQGQAGSGKTTLLQWIAVRAATNSFEGELARWNGKIPFYIRLRQYAQSRLPRPKDFPEFSAPMIVDTMPEHWVHDILKAGRALVLVDGVDEVSLTQREEVHSWLKDLVGTYGACSFIVTSRPHAIEDGWMNHESFGDAMLQDMDLGDIYAFIEHWHEAVRQELQTDEEKRELEPLADHLKEQVRRTRAVQKLATNPLLCAMLCALNRERRQQLPVNRIELYDACISLLIERREKESKIDLSDYPALSYSQKQRLLQDLAYWMIRENLSEAETREIDERFDQRLRDMPNITSEVNGKMVRKLFVERAAMLREPVAGRIDFTHRSFEEFFAAKAIAHVSAIEELVAHAHDYQWREVIILTAGFVTKPVCEQLVQGLIARGDEDKKLRYQLHLIAVACLETAIELGPEVRAEVEARLSKLVPPKNMTDAKALAAAGELAVKYLDKKRLMRNGKLAATVCAACVRALSLIGSDAALDMLEGYADDERETVVEELIKAWSSFDRAAYARHVLAKTLQNKTSIRLKTPSLDGIQYLTALEDLDLSYNYQLSDLTPLLSLLHLRTLNLYGCKQVKDLGPLSGLSNLSNLNLSGCEQVSELGPLFGLSNLSVLNLSRCGQVSELGPLAGLSNLNWLDLEDCSQVSDLRPLAGLSKLYHLDLQGCSQIKDLVSFDGLVDLYIVR